MEKINQITAFYLYELQLQGIRCTGCANRICKNLKDSYSIIDAKVNVLAEKLQITMKDQSNIPQILDKIKSMDFKILSEPREIKLDGNDLYKREIFFIFEEVMDIHNKLDVCFKEKPGILKCEITNIYSRKSFLQLKIVYNPLVVKARWVYEQLTLLNFQGLEVHNPHLDNFKSKNNLKRTTTYKDLLLALFTVAFFIIFALVFPLFDFFYKAIIFPLSFNIFSIYTIFMLVITILVMLKFGFKTYKNSITNFYHSKSLNMESLITLGSLSSFFMSIFLIIGYGIENSSKTPDNISIGMEQDMNSERKDQILMIVEMLETTSLILAIITIGKFLEDKAKMHIVKMTDEIFPENTLLKNTELEYIEPKNRNFMIESRKNYEISLIDRDDLIEVKGPMKLLLDGVILHIDSENKHGIKVIDSACFGWDDAFYAQKGDRIKSGAEILEGKAIVQVENVIENSVLCQMSKQLNVVQNNIETSENGISVLFAKLAANFVKIIILFSIITLIVWLIIIGTDSVNIDQYCKWCFPFERAISVLVASCPCALGLAIPSVIVIALNLAMKNSILIKKNTFFEKINKVNCVIFDKTGTLFTKVEEISEYKRFGADQYEEDEIWQIISLLEKSSNHPLGQLMYKEAIKRIKTTVFNINYVLLDKPSPNKNGVIAQMKCKNNNSDTILNTYIGNRRLNPDLKLEDNIEKEILIHESLGQTALLFSINKELVMLIYLDNSSNLRPESKALIQYLQTELHKEVYILSGDSSETVIRIGEFLNIPHHRLFGNVDAQSKKTLLKKLKDKEHKEVMMIGDGINDVLSIQEATVGVSINSKSELNIIASDVIALNENLWKIVSLFNLSKMTRLFIIVNLCWAFAYNILVIPIAAGALTSAGFMIPPFFSSVAMSASSLIVVLFSNLMRFIRFDPTKRKNWKGSDVDDIKDLKSRLIEEKKKLMQTKPSFELDIIEKERVGDAKISFEKGVIVPIEHEKPALLKSEEVITLNSWTGRGDGNQK